VTFSDNYDDAYKSSPAWDPKIMARRPDGQLWLSRNWTGEDPPLDAGRVAFYALEEQELRAPLPRNLGGCEHCGHRRPRGKGRAFACGAAGGVIRVRVPARQPVIVLVDGAKKRVSDSS
jgi:hypothetical protein